MHSAGDLTVATLLWTILGGIIAPLPAYVFNGHVLERLTKHPVPEPIKGFVFLVSGAISGVITKAIDNGTVGFNHATLQAIEIGILTAIVVHYGYRAGGINVALNGGNTTGMDGTVPLKAGVLVAQNREDDPGAEAYARRRRHGS